MINYLKQEITMKKKKYDLTSDLVDVGNTPKVIKQDKEMNKLVLVTLSIEEIKRAEFKSWCARHRYKMKEAFIEGFKLLKERHGE